MRQPTKLLSISAGHDAIACAFVLGRQPMDWQMSFTSTQTVEQLSGKITQWLDYYQPDRVLLPTYPADSHKGQQIRILIASAEQTAREAKIPLSHVSLQHDFANKYKQIEYLTERYHQLQPITVPNRKYYEKENTRITYFEAVGMVEGFYA